MGARKRERERWNQEVTLELRQGLDPNSQHFVFCSKQGAWRAEGGRRKEVRIGPKNEDICVGSEQSYIVASPLLSYTIQANDV